MEWIQLWQLHGPALLAQAVFWTDLGNLSFSPYDTPDGKYDKRIGEETAKTFS